MQYYFLLEWTKCSQGWWSFTQSNLWLRGGCTSTHYSRSSCRLTSSFVRTLFFRLQEGAAGRPCLSAAAWQSEGRTEDRSGNRRVYLKPFPSHRELRGRPAVSAVRTAFTLSSQPNDGENYPRRRALRLDYRAARAAPSWHLGKHLQEHIVRGKTRDLYFHTFSACVFSAVSAALFYTEVCCALRFNSTDFIISGS